MKTCKWYSYKSACLLGVSDSEQNDLKVSSKIPKALFTAVCEEDTWLEAFYIDEVLISSALFGVNSRFSRFCRSFSVADWDAWVCHTNASHL